MDMAVILWGRTDFAFLGMRRRLSVVSRDHTRMFKAFPRAVTDTCARIWHTRPSQKFLIPMALLFQFALNFVLVLVSAAVDGVCLQTSESIGCAEELGLPAVVVLNKIDLLPDEVAAQVSILPLSHESLGPVRCVDRIVVHYA